MVERYCMWNHVLKMKLLLQICISVMFLSFTVPSCSGKLVRQFENSIMESILRKYTNLSTLKICEISIKRATNSGERYTSDLYRIHANGFKNGGNCGSSPALPYDYTKQLVMKMPHEDGFDSHLFEIFVYENALPALQENLPPDTYLEFPKMVHSAPRYMLLEDWMQTEYSKLDRNSPYIREILESTLKELAKLHSASIIMKQNARENFTYITANLRDNLMNPLKEDKLFEIFNESFQTAKSRSTSPEFMAETLPNEKKQIEKVFKVDPREIFNNASASIRKTPEDLDVIVHGDFWQDNVMCIKNDPGNIKIIDPANLCKSNLVRDLIYIFATTPMVKEDRYTAIQFYTQHLKFLLQQGRVEGETVEKYTTKLVMDEIKRLSHFEFVIGNIYGLPRHLTSPVPSPELIEGLTPAETRDFLLDHFAREYILRVRYLVSNFYENADI